MQNDYTRCTIYMSDKVEYLDKGQELSKFYAKKDRDCTVVLGDHYKRSKKHGGMASNDSLRSYISVVLVPFYCYMQRNIETSNFIDTHYAV